MAFSWNCPFCNHNAIVTSENSSGSRFEFNHDNKYGYQAIITRAVVCPNPECKEYSLSATLHDHIQVSSGWEDRPSKKEWSLIPQAQMKVFPDYVPKAIVDDYEEACSIKNLSPKASATLARRCLQGMIRDYWGIKKGRLVDEIEAIQEKVDPITWAAIDSVRKIGNIGAHMERDINLIIEVDPKEAALLIGLIETLINDWYVNREERMRRLEAIVNVAEQKHSAKENA